ncbi:MAG: repressor LexA [Anaerolineales bacterium]|nr:repressor LexA [Chloroflexota bacterium]MBL6980789.1 repressor LexA [Anaerolineales bacterium]
MMARRKKEGLNEKHIKVLHVLYTYTGKHGYPPTIREICERAELSSTSVANYYLERLEEKGYIQRDRGISRGLKVTLKYMKEFGVQVRNAVDELLQIPMVGRIVASEPVPFPTSDFSSYDYESGSINIAESLLSPQHVRQGNLFALEVSGDSMIDAMVNDGDVVIMQPATNVRDGEMVAVWLNDKDETTLKYFYNEGSRVRLQPANPTMDAIYVNDPSTVEIRGRVVMVVRQMEMQ